MDGVAPVLASWWRENRENLSDWENSRSLLGNPGGFASRGSGLQ